MKMEHCHVGEARVARAHWEARKEHKPGDAMGRPSRGWSFLGDPGAIFFLGKRGNGPNGKCRPEPDGLVRSFLPVSC
jgi:hypothetical protein